MQQSNSLNDYFSQFRSGILGINLTIRTPFDDAMPLVHADWAAVGRAYVPIEQRISTALLPMPANAHADTSAAGGACIRVYRTARAIIRNHVNADTDDILVMEGSGTSGVVKRLQRMLGLRAHDRLRPAMQCEQAQRPVVFITHMEHPSNRIAWLETLADVVIVAAGPDGLVDPERFRAAAASYAARPLKIAAVTACSHATGILTPYHAIAKVMHEAGGYCFVDFTCSAPYATIDMHPADPLERLDAVYFSFHTFLGGAGTPDALLFNGALYRNDAPDLPGGAVEGPPGGRRHIDEADQREDGGTPAFTQAIRAALCLHLKEQMGVDNIGRRERELTAALMSALTAIPGIHVLAAEHRERLPIVSLYIDGLHHKLAARMLSDRYGIQVRGGCSGAGTCGHYLPGDDGAQPNAAADAIDHGDAGHEPGWLRVSLHPTSTDREVDFIVNAIAAMARMHRTWRHDYLVDPRTNSLEFHFAQLDAHIAREIEHAVFAPLPTGWPDVPERLRKNDAPYFGAYGDAPHVG